MTFDIIIAAMTAKHGINPEWGGCRPGILAGASQDYTFLLGYSPVGFSAREVAVAVEEKRPIDHINHDTLDNRRSCNVRFSDHFLNSLNREITIPRQDKNPLRSGKYIASIMVKGRLIRIGVFNTPEESVLARVAVRSFALQYFGNDNETDCQYVDVGCDKHGSA